LAPDINLADVLPGIRQVVAFGLSLGVLPRFVPYFSPFSFGAVASNVAQELSHEPVFFFRWRLSGQFDPGGFENHHFE